MIQFTGNWYIDMGIIGMLKLLENEFPEKTLEQIRNMPYENGFSYLFTRAYFKYHLSDQETKLNNEKHTLREKIERKKEQKKKSNEHIKKLEDEINSLNYKIKCNKNLSKVLDQSGSWKNFIDQSENARADFKKEFKKMSFKGSFYLNFKFFNNSTNLDAQVKDWEDFVINTTSHFPFEASLNKGLPSNSDYRNIYYATPEFTKVPSLQKLNPLIPLLCGEVSFTPKKIAKQYYFLYSPRLEWSYAFNKKLGEYLTKPRDQGSDIIRISYSAILDSLIELKSDFALQNLYLISYETLEKQRFRNFEYLGINRMNARILNNEKIRDKLNFQYYTYLKISDDKSIAPSSEIQWALMVLIKQNSIMKSLYKALLIPKREANRKTSISKWNCLMLLAIACAKAEFREHSGTNSVFQFKLNVSNTQNIDKQVLDINDIFARANRPYKEISYAIYVKKETQVKEEVADSEFQYLIKLVKREQRFKFINYIMNMLLTSPQEQSENKNKIVKYLFDHVMKKPTWQYYALGMVFRNFNQTITK